VSEKLKFLFDNHDADGSGFLEHSEILPMFKRLAQQLESLETSAKKRNAFKGSLSRIDDTSLSKLADEFETASDLDGDGQISYDEFETFMESNELMNKFLKIMQVRRASEAKVL